MATKSVSQLSPTTVAADPSVTTLARWAFTPVRPDSVEEAGAFIGLDDPFLDEVYRPVVIEGRRSRPGTDEVMANETLAETADLASEIDLVAAEAARREAERAIAEGFSEPADLARARAPAVLEREHRADDAVERRQRVADGYADARR